jgi:hypothetical protein
VPVTSTKRTITYPLKSLNIKKTTTYDIGNPGPDLGQAQKCGGFKHLYTHTCIYQNFLL